MEVAVIKGAKGAQLTVEFSSKETIVNLSVSDNGLLKNEDESPRTISVSDGGTQSKDRNLMASRVGAFLFLKPLRDLTSQPITVLTRMEDGTMRRYTMELATVPFTEAYFTVRFTYETEERAEQAKRARDAAAAAAQFRAQRVASARLAAVNLGGEIVKNKNYQGQGEPEDIAALAPRSGSKEPSIWDDGQRTYLRYAGNRRTPVVYEVRQDKQEAIIDMEVARDPTTNGRMVILPQVYREMKLRDGKLVVCVFNRAYDSTGQNPGTFTVTPDVVREPVPEDAPRVR